MGAAIGTTSFDKYMQKKRLAVVTNSLLVGNELAGVEHVELYMAGVNVGGYLSATMGEAE